MKRVLFLLVLLVGIVFIWAETINVPEDYETIQSAIEVAVDGDEIIVSPGTYYENIDFDGKAIMLASLFYTTQDTSYISQTIIDGCENGSVVTFDSEEGSESVLTGFTITNGYTENYGGGIYASGYCSPTLNNLRIISNHADSEGGGYYFGAYCNSELNNLLVADNTAYNGAGGAYSYYCEQIMENSVIRGNVSENNGGAICCEESDLSFNNVILEDNTAGRGGGLYQVYGTVSLIGVNIQGNQVGTSGGGIASYGETYLESVNITENSACSSGGGIWCTYFPLEFCEEIEGRCNLYNNNSQSGIGSDIFCQNPQNVILNTFSVETPTDFYAAPGEYFNFDIIDGLNAQIDGDVYVSALGSNENSGLSADQPLQTIRHACSLMAVSEETPHTIFLGAGTYSATETGESYPIHLPDYVFLCGVNRESVILDAEGNSGVMELIYVDNVGVSGLTICNGSCLNGGGINGYQAHAELSDLIIKDNNASGSGGGLRLFCGYSILKNTLIYGNSANDNGGGLSVGSNGLYVMQNVTVWGNSAGSEGGGMYIVYPQANIINSIFSNNEPGAVYGYGYNSELSLAYTDIDGGASEIHIIQGQTTLLEGMIYDAPLFIDAENGDFHLADDSPCIDMGIAYFEYEDQVWVDMPGNEYWGEAPDMGAYEYVSIKFGDVDDNGLVESYDASLVLMHVVGIDGLEEDPLPWEEWRWLRADVDIDGEIGAVDGAYILQYVVGIIGELPVYNNNRAVQSLLTLANDEEYIYLSSDEPVIGLSYKILRNSNVKLGKAEILAENCLHYQNDGLFAMATATGVTGNLLRFAFDTTGSHGSIQIELSGNGYREVIDYYLDDGVPESSDFCSIYPNPFNPETTIEYSLAESGNVSIDVFNVKGQRVSEILNEHRETGTHTLIWNADDLNSGMYFIRIASGEFQSVKKAILLK